MIAVVEAIVFARQMNPAFRALAKDGKEVTFCSRHSGLRDAQAYPRVEIGIASQRGSQVNAGVPFEITEELTVANPEELLLIVDALLRNPCAGVYRDDAAVWDMNPQQVSVENDVGNSRKATITWGVVASWRPAA